MLFRKCRARQSMQRLGICKLFAIWAGEVRSISGASQRLKSELTKKVTVSFDSNFYNWFKKKPNDRSQLDSEKRIVTQLQDFYIYNHPSQTGWLSKHGFKEYTESLPRQLNIVDSSYDITDMGQVLPKGLMDDGEHQAFLSISEKCNPLLLTVGQKIFFLYNLFLSDGDFFIPFVYNIYSTFNKQQFNYLDAGNLIPNVIDSILKSFSGTAYTSSHREQLVDLEKMKSTIQKVIQDKSERKGSGSRREQECIPRLEWMVDLDILTKASSRTYAITDLGETVLTNFGKIYEKYLTKGFPDQAIRKIVDNDFYEIIRRPYFSEFSTEKQTINLIEFIGDSYDKLKGIGGYCLFRPLLLLANINNLSHEQKVFLEYSNGVDLLEKSFRNDPEKIYYTTDRLGTDVQIKIL